MFSFIVTIFAIVLVGILAVATVYYIENASKGSAATAQSARYLQEGSQLVGALEMYKVQNDGQMPTGDEQQIKDTLLKDGKYLKGWPQDSWKFSTDYAFRAEVSQDACAAVNKKLGISGVPSCSDSAYEGKSVCCSVN